MPLLISHSLRGEKHQFGQIGTGDVQGPTDFGLRDVVGQGDTGLVAHEEFIDPVIETHPDDHTSSQGSRSTSGIPDIVVTWDFT